MILETKLTLPQPKAGALLRTGLIELIKNNLDKKLILITADAGYGKTTLLAQLIGEARLPAVFYDLDKDDGDLLTFYAYLAAGLEKLSPGLAVRSAVLLTQAGQTGSDHELLMGTLINELFEKRKEELFFVLDDYQHLSEESPVHQALDFFIDHMPETVHVIIASRAAVWFANYAKWYAKQNAFEVRRSDLCFSEDDVQELLAKTYSQMLGEADLKSLLEHTEGWIIGIQLIMAHIHETEHGKTVKDSLTAYLKGVPSSPGGLFQYFASEIFSSESQEIKDFLAGSAILDLMTPEVCDEILGICDSSRRLQDLERRNLFTSCLGPKEYKYHRLFRDFLDKQFGNETKQPLHLKAAIYYENKGRLVEAIDHYLAAGDYDNAADAIDNAAQEMADKAKFALLSDWLNRIPKHLFEQKPRLMVIKARLFREQGNMEAAENLYLQAQRTTTVQPPLSGKKPPDPLVLPVSLLGQAMILQRRGQPLKAISLLGKALRACPASNQAMKGGIYNSLALAWQSMGNFRKAKTCLIKARALAGQLRDAMTILRMNFNWALQYYKTGEIKSALAACKALLEQAKDNYFVGIGNVFTTAANTAMILGEDEWAKQCLDQGFHLAKTYNDAISQFAIDFSYGGLYAGKEQWEKAREHLENSLQAFAKMGWTEAEVNALRMLARVCRYRQEYEKARQYLTQAFSKLRSGEDINYLNLLIERIFLAIAGRRLENADSDIKAGLDLARKYGIKCELFQLQLAQAAACLCRDRKKEAARCLGQAIKLSRIKGYDGILIRELRHNEQLAEFAFAKGIGINYLAALKPRIMKQDDEAARPIMLRARLFGSLQLCMADERQIPLKWRYSKSASLLAYLLLHRDRVCHRDELMETLWPRVPAVPADKYLRNSIHNIKKALAAGWRRTGQPAPGGAFIEHLEKGYRLAAGVRYLLDVEEFCSVWEAARNKDIAGNKEESLQDYRRCLELYHGDFLSNIADIWCEERRERCQKMHLSALQKLAVNRLEAGDYDETEDYCRRYFVRDPYSEEMHITLWKALKGSGRRDEIRVDHDRFRKLLWKDLREKMRPETQLVYDNLISDN